MIYTNNGMTLAHGKNQQKVAQGVVNNLPHRIHQNQGRTVVKRQQPQYVLGTLAVAMLALAGPASADIQYSSTPQAGYFDFGDAPDSYGTTLAHNGARAADGTALYLGSPTTGGAPDYETDAIPAVYPGKAISDDLTGMAGLAEETGVKFLGSFTQKFGNTMCNSNPLTYVASCWGKVEITVTALRNLYAGGSVYLDGWLDWGHDGSFATTGLEHIVSDSWSATDLSTWTSDTRTFTYWFLDNTGPEGPFYARFRISEAPNAPTGASAYGEVEDYGGLGHGQTPEIDPASGGNALAMLIGGVALMAERRRRAHKSSAT